MIVLVASRSLLSLNLAINYQCVLRNRQGPKTAPSLSAPRHPAGIEHSSTSQPR